MLSKLLRNRGLALVNKPLIKNKYLSTIHQPVGEIYVDFLKSAMWPFIVAIVSFTFGTNSTVISHESQIKNVDKSLDILTNSVNANKIEVREDIKSLKEDIKEDLKSFKEDMKLLKEDMKFFKEDIKEDLKSFKEDVKEDMKSFKEEFKHLNTSIDKLQTIISLIKK